MPPGHSAAPPKAWGTSEHGTAIEEAQRQLAELQDSLPVAGLAVAHSAKTMVARLLTGNNDELVEIDM